MSSDTGIQGCDLQGSDAEARPSAMAGLWAAFRSTVQGVDRPRQLAWGLTIGLGVGLLPKYSLLVPLIIAGLILSRANLLTALLGIVFGSLTAPLVAPLALRWGEWLAVHPIAQSSLAELQAMPLVPWLCLNDTLVLGTMGFILAAGIPMFVVSLLFFNWYRPALIRFLGARSATRWLVG